VITRTLARVREAGTFYLLLAALAGCATRGQVRVEVDRLAQEEASLDRLEQRLASLTAAIGKEEKTLQARREAVGETASQALLASDEAREAEDLATGRLLGETVFRVSGIRFEPGTTTLTAESRSLLDQLVERLRAEDAGYYLEVRSRAAGDAGDAGDLLGDARAESVRRYLHDDRGLPLHVVSTMAAARELSPPAPAEDLLEVAPAGESSLAVVVVRPFPRP
jgi:outer membrane protein OmpA-like peptidoglycan-associated protein